MLTDFFGVMMSSSGQAAPSTPGAASLSTYGGSLVQVNWTNHASAVSSGWQTKVYRLSGGSWLLLTTAAVGTTSYQTGLSSSNGYTYGVAHFSPTTGLTSTVRTATALPPSAPTNVSTSLYAGTKVQVNWTSTGLQTRCYRKTNGAGAWILRTTIAAGTSAWQTGDLQSAGHAYGVSAFNGSQESSIVTAGAA